MTVTSCATFQFAAVKVSDGTDTVPSVTSELVREMVTSAVGWLVSTTEKKAVLPASVVMTDSGVTLTPGGVAAGSTVITTVSVSVSAPPAPVLPRSEVTRVRVSVPLKPGPGR